MGDADMSHNLLRPDSSADVLHVHGGSPSASSLATLAETPFKQGSYSWEHATQVGPARAATRVA